jgi:hypothetical protein
MRVTTNQHSIALDDSHLELPVRVTTIYRDKQIGGSYVDPWDGVIVTNSNRATKF